MNTIQLKDYLYRIYQLENSLYQQRFLMQQLNIRIAAKKEKREQTYEKTISIGQSFVENAFWLFATPAIVYMVTLILFYIARLLFLDISDRAISISSLIIALLFLVRKIISIFLNTKKHNSEITKKNSIIKTNNDKNLSLSKKQLIILQQEQQILSKSIMQTQNILNQYYNIGIIYPKYRELIAVSSFYEYLSSGRCSQLEGHEGAYNIFEMESRQDLILRKLDDIISRLDSIEQNQYMLYTAIQNSNRETNMMLNELNRTANSIETNSTITAYNSRITAQNTEFLKWIKFLE